MILFFPQYQAGVMPSHIPTGTKALRKLLEHAPDFAEVPVEISGSADPQIVRGVRYREVLKRQLNNALEIVKRLNPDWLLTTGGDCGASFVPIAHLNKKCNGKMGLLWIDAHGDIHSPETSPSGNYHGMVLRHLLGHPSFDIKPPLPLLPHQIAYLGLRDTEPEEDAVIADLKIPHFSSVEIMNSNVPLDSVIAHFKSHGITHLHLHVDCDVMDKDFFPHVDVPESGGISLDRLLEILQYLRRKMPCPSFCLTEYAPRIEGEGIEIMKRIYTEGFGLTLPE